MKTHILNTWQQKWDSSQKGRITYEYFREVGEIISALHIKPDYYKQMYRYSRDMVDLSKNYVRWD